MHRLLDEIDAQKVLGYACFEGGKITESWYLLEKFHANVAGKEFR